MNRNELVRDIVRRTGFTIRDISEVIDAYEDSIIDAVSRGDIVTIYGFMKIEKSTRNRSVYDFRTNQPGETKQHTSVKISPGAKLLGCLNTGN